MKKIWKIIVAMLCMTVFVSCAAQGFNVDREITVISRDSASGTREAFENGVGLLENKVSLLKEGAEELASTGAVIEKVKADAQAIGYISVGLINDDIKALKLNGIAPTMDTIQDGTYALQRPFIVVYKESTLQDSLKADFEKFLRSKKAVDIITEEGFVALTGTVNGKDYGEIYSAPASSLSGTVNVEGSTSVGPVMEILAEEYKKINTGVTINVTQNGSSNGLSSAKEGTSDFGMMSKDLSSSETTVVKTQIAIDGVALIVNKENTFDNITTAQVKAIYIKEGKGVDVITKWSELI